MLAIVRLLGCMGVDAFGLKLHLRDLLAHCFQSQPTHEPSRTALHDTLDILPPDQRDVFAELLTKERNQPVPMAVLLRPHFSKCVGRRWIIGLKPFSEVIVDRRVFFLEGNGQRQDFPLAEALESSHVHLLFSLEPCSPPALPTTHKSPAILRPENVNHPPNRRLRTWLTATARITTMPTMIPS